MGGNYWSLSLIYLLRACAQRCWRHFGVGIPQGNLKECRQRIQNILANFNGIYSTGHPGIILLSSDRANQPNHFGTYVLETFTAKIEKKTISNLEDSSVHADGQATFAVERWTPWGLGLYSLSGKTSYRQISWSLEAAILGVIIITPLWNLTGTSATLLPMGLSNFRAIGKV